MKVLNSYKYPKTGGINMAEKQRILIVDDDYNIAELISLYLTKECFETKIVGDGEEALRVFPEFPAQPDSP